MSDSNLSPNLPADVCVHSRIRGRSIDILQAIKKYGPLMFWEVRDNFQISKNLANNYLRNLRNYGLIEKTKQGWTLTEKGKQFLEKHERVVTKMSANLSPNLCTNLCANLSPQSASLYANLCAYNNNNNEINNNNINNIGNSSIFATKVGSFNNKIVPSFMPPLFGAQKNTHTFSFQFSELQKVKEAFLSKFGTGATIGKKVVYQLVSTSLPYIDKRTIKARVDKLISLGFLKEVGNGLYKIVGGESNETV
jgi:predicted transcriptional regulator/uncharacterized protein YlbG (UPF0298 family)